MASEEDLDLAETEESSSGGGSKVVIIIILAAVLLGGGGGVAIYFLMGDSTPDKVSATAAEAPVPVAAEKKPVANTPNIYVPIPQAILVQITDGRKTRMMQVKITLVVHASDAKDAVMQQMPLVRNNLLMFLSGTNVKEALTAAGKRKLKQGSLKVVQDLLKQQTGKPLVDDLLFVGFVMQ